MLGHLKTRAAALGESRFAQDTSGNMGVILAVCLSMIGVGIGAAVDTTRLVKNDQKLQDNLDAASIYVARLPSGEDIQTAGQAFLDSHVDNGDIENLVGTFKLVDEEVVASASGDVPLAFRGLLGKPSSGVYAETTINLPPTYPPCIVALSQTKTPGITLNAGATINSESCEVHVHSMGNPAMTINSGTTLNTARTCVAGAKINNNSSDASRIETRCNVAADPYAGKIPEPVNSFCDYNSENHSRSETTLSPGTYCGQHNFQGNDPQINLEPGLYIIRGGGWNVNSGNMIGDGVTFFLADNSNIQFNSSVEAKLTAPTSGPYKDILMTESGDQSNGRFVINDNKGFDFEGVIHLPSRKITMNSGSTIRSRKLSIIADSIVINGAVLNIDPIEKSETDSKTVYLSR